MLTDTTANCEAPAAADSLDDIEPVIAMLESGPAIEQVAFPRKSGAIAIVDQGVASASTFFASVIVGRSCGSTELGIYSLAFTLMLLCFAVQDALVIAALTVFYHDRAGGRHHTRDEYLAITSRQQLLISLALSGILLIVGVGLLAFDSSRLGGTVMAVAIALPFILFREFARRAHCIRGELVSALRLDGVVSVIWMSLLVILAWRHELTPASVFISQAIACAYALTRRNRTPFKSADVWPHIAKNMHFGKWIVASQMASLSHQYLAYWLLAAWHGPEATGGFAAAVSLVAITNPLTLGLGNYFGPKMSHDLATGGIERFVKTTGGALLFMGAVMSMVVAFFALGGGSLLPLLFGKDFHGQHAIITILAFGSFIAAMRMIVDLAVRTLKQPAWVFLASMGGVIANVTVAITLMPRWKELGAAYGNVAGGLTPLVLLGVAFWVSLKSLPQPRAIDA
jgi:O-antigen/teichoic acid export membrane protein